MQLFDPIWVLATSLAFRAARDRQAKPGNQNDFPPSVHVFPSDPFFKNLWKSNSADRKAHCSAVPGLETNRLFF
jgi:hypothetical protein